MIAREPDRRTHVIREDQERRTIWDHSSVERHSVHDRAHAVLAYSKMEIPTGVISGPKLGAPFTIVLVEDARSAEPPTSSGTFGAIALITTPDAARLATLPLSAVKVGMKSSQPPRARHVIRPRARSLHQGGSICICRKASAIQPEASVPRAPNFRQCSRASGAT